MNRKQFQEWLDQFPEDTEVHVAIQHEAPCYQAYGCVTFEKFTGSHWDDYEYMVYNDGRKELQLGCKS